MKLDLQHLPLPTKLASRWFGKRTFGAGQIPPLRELCARKRAEGLRISVGVPALNEAETIARICRIISRELMDKTPLVDELIVLDGDSVDETAVRARTAGARVASVATIMPEIAHHRGKGESLWRSLATLRGDIVVWVDADIRNFGPHFVTRLVAPLLCDPSIDFVKGYYRRPIALDGVVLPSGGGRVTELLARPLLDLLFPELAGILQPLAGEYAGRTEILRKLPFFTGYSVEVGLLIDLLDVAGLDGIAQADLGSRVHRNRPLEELGPMAFGIARTILQRAEERERIKGLLDMHNHPLLRRAADGGLEAHLPEELERPPIDLMPLRAEALCARELVDAAL